MSLSTSLTIPYLARSCSSLLGSGPLAAAVLTWRRHRLAPLLACATGEALIIWLAVEIAIVGYTNKPPLQAFYLVLGVVIVLVGIHWLRLVRSPGRPTGQRDTAGLG